MMLYEIVVRNCLKLVSNSVRSPRIEKERKDDT